MRRVIGSVMLAAVFLAAAATAASAQTSSYPPSPSPTTIVRSGGHGDAAFTGGNVIPGLIVIAVLTAAGVLAVFWADRKRPNVTDGR